MSNALVARGAAPMAMTAGILGLEPRDMITRATAIADALRDIIVKQGLWVKIKGRDYVKAEGWATMGSLLGILPKEERVLELEDGSYEAHVNLVDFRSGTVLGGASALCGVDEERWRDAERYARRSMAITRATGKAYRLGFAWVMSLAGYEPTPFEEVPHEIVVEHEPVGAAAPRQAPRPAPTPAARGVPEPTERRQAKVYTREAAQVTLLHGLLAKRDVPPEIWGHIDAELLGKPFTALATIVPAERAKFEAHLESLVVATPVEPA